MSRKKPIVELISFLFILIILIYTFIGVCYYTFNALIVITNGRFVSTPKVIGNIFWFIFSVLLITLIFTVVIVVLGVRK